MADLLLNISYDPPAQKSVPKSFVIVLISCRSLNQLCSKATDLGKRKRAETAAKGTAPQPIKRRKLGVSTDAQVHSTASAKKRNYNIVSSLFTSNPILPNLSLNDKAERSKATPSNAPLADSSTFEGLGLNRLLINHLQSKMSIKNPTSIQKASLPYLLEPYNKSIPPRDVFLQSQTGSGKTLAFLLPIIQDLLPLSSLSYIDRSVGTLAIIIAPTRELAKQISDVLEELVKMRLRESEDVPEDNAEPRLTRWLVSGLLSGGATRAHEKARLRKGLPILVATPGRLLDHLQNSTAFNVGKCRWLVLDEADRLMELGFEETIQGILKGLDGRRKLAIKAVQEGQGMEIGGWEWRERRTVLCSATIREDVQKLAGTALIQPIIIKGDVGDATVDTTKATATGQDQETKLTPPSQLSQKYVVTPLKQRLVTLVALLRFLINRGTKDMHATATQIIVFLSCTDSVDFHWTLFGKAKMGAEKDERVDEKESPGNGIHSTLLPGALIYRLHGSLPLSERLAGLRGFSNHKAKSRNSDAKKGTEGSSILFCTSVASRGLDLPLVRAVVQYDLPTEGGATEYIHRVGRTARAGKGGEAWNFVSPSEVAWISWVEERMKAHTMDEDNTVKLTAVDATSILRKGFGGKGSEYEDRATEVQLALEGWVLSSNTVCSIIQVN
jgi:ATP-dependent RNA helicase DDX31/DBP7